MDLVTEHMSHSSCSPTQLGNNSQTDNLPHTHKKVPAPRESGQVSFERLLRHTVPRRPARLARGKSSALRAESMAYETCMNYEQAVSAAFRPRTCSIDGLQRKTGHKTCPWRGPVLQELAGCESMPLHVGWWVAGQFASPKTLLCLSSITFPPTKKKKQPQNPRLA